MRGRSGSDARAAALFLIAVLAVACGGSTPAPSGSDVDLVAESAHARPLGETTRIDPDTLEGVSRLGAGWSRRPTAAGDPSALVARGARATIRFTHFQPRPVRLSMRCAAEMEGASGVRVALRINGMYLGTVRFPETLEHRRERIPARALEVGDNLLEMRLAIDGAFPASAGRGRDKAPEPGIVCRTIEFESAAPGRQAVAVEATVEPAPALRIPYLGGLELFRRIGPGAELALDGLEAWGAEAPSPRLRVVLRFDGGEPERTVEVAPGAGEAALRMPIPVDGARPLAISLIALPGGDPPAEEGGLRVVRPVLRGTAGAGTPAVASSRWTDEGTRLEDPPRPDQPNVIVYLIDTLRADHLGVYGRDRETSPRIDEFAREAVQFRRAVAPSPWTKPSVASLFTGLLPQHHGVHDRADLMAWELPTLAGLLRIAGYETAGFITNSTVSHDFRFDLGFHQYRFLPERPTREVHQLSDALNETAFGWLERRRSSRPLFAYLHATDPHEPYTPRQPFRDRLAGNVRNPDLNKGLRVREALAANPDLDLQRVRSDMEALYDGEIAFNDRSFGALTRRLREAGLWQSSVVVLVSDHGEEFLDHGGWSHGATLYQEMLHVPMMIKFPDGWGAGRIVEERVSLVDVMPTILDLIGIEPPEGIDGRSLIPVIRDPSGGSGPPALAHMGVGDQWLESLSHGRLKVIRHLTAAGKIRELELYDLIADPGEREDLAGRRPVTAGYLATLLDRTVTGGPASRAAEEIVMDEELARRLRALGYVQ